MSDCSMASPELLSSLELEIQTIRQLLTSRGVEGEKLSIEAARGSLCIKCRSRDFLAIGDLWMDIDRATEGQYTKIIVECIDREARSIIPLGLPS